MSIFRLGFATGILCISSIAFADVKLNAAWQLDGLATPESVLYYKEKDKEFVFVSQIEGDPSQVDGKGGIALISTDGKMVNKDWVTGLSAPKGMAARGNLLYVSDINQLVAIDITKGKVTAKYPASGSEFLNDVAVDSAGNVFVSDTRAKKIYQLKKDKLDIYLKNVDNANGLTFVKSGMVVGAGKEMQLVSSDKKITLLAKDFGENIDGIEEVGANEFVVSCWPGLVYYVNAKGQLTQLIDSRTEKVNTADIGYYPGKKLVMVPNFFKNTVTAYELVVTK